MQDQQSPTKLYIVVRADLPIGLQAAQAAHAAFEFSARHRAVTLDWLGESNYLVIVAVPDEKALTDLHGRAVARGIVNHVVREPDLDDQMTALTLSPSDEARRLCANFPLALREPAMAA